MRDADPYVMYLVVREPSTMSTGKLAAQVGHGVELVIRANFSTAGVDLAEASAYTHWAHADSTKIVLAASSAEFEKLKAVPQRHFVVVDLGYTELPANTETVMAFWPMRKSERNKSLKRLRVL